MSENKPNAMELSQSFEKINENTMSGLYPKPEQPKPMGETTPVQLPPRPIPFQNPMQSMKPEILTPQGTNPPTLQFQPMNFTNPFQQNSMQSMKNQENAP